MKYRKKPIEVEAIQWTGYNIEEIKSFVGETLHYNTFETSYGTAYTIMKISTLEGDMIASIGDYIIRGVNGEYYPCKEDIFLKTYEKVEG